MTRRVWAMALRRMAPNSGERWESAMEPRRFVEGSGKHRWRMVDSTAEGRLVGPGEKLSALEEGQLTGGLSEPLRAGWLGSTFSTVMMGACSTRVSSAEVKLDPPLKVPDVIVSMGAIFVVNLIRLIDTVNVV